MSTDELARGMVLQARQRLKVLPILLEDGAHSVVVRESQEVVELSLKGLLRACGIEPPKIHDVSRHLVANAEIIRSMGVENSGELAAASKHLRKERELSFYGEPDFIPTESYTREQAAEALEMARRCVAAADRVLEVCGGPIS